MARTDVYKYATNAATTGDSIIMGCKMSAASKAVSGAEAAGTLPPKYGLVDCTRNAKSAGISPRFWSLTRLSGSGPKVAKVPILTAAQYDTKNDGDTISVLGGTYTVTKIDENGYK